jgi:excisionase family DNA binding protein
MLALCVALCNAQRMIVPTHKLIGSAEAATILGVNKSTIIRWVAAGKLQPLQKLHGANGLYVFNRDDIEELVA